MSPSSADCFLVNQTMSADKRLQEDEEKAQEELDVILSRLLRIRRQRKSLRERGAESFARGVQSLDEMDAEEADLTVQEQSAVGDAQSMGAVGVVDWSVWEPNFGSFLDSALRVGPGSAGETPQASAGSASNA
jgi:hypothetical protein